MNWGLGIGDWGLGPIPNPQSPIPNFGFDFLHINMFSKVILKIIILILNSTVILNKVLN